MIDCRLSGELPRVPKKRPSRLSLSPLLPEQEGAGDATLPMADSGMIRAHQHLSERADASPETQDAAKSASLLPPPGMALGTFSMPGHYLQAAVCAPSLLCTCLRLIC